jgi:predicted exporter
MRNKLQCVLLFSCLSLLGCAQTVHADEAAEKAAQSAASQWLALVDQGKYAESWEAAAAYFKNALPEQQWLQSMNGARKPLGKVISRKLLTARFMTSLPGAPDGQYVVIQYATSFEHKASAVETVTPMLDPDGKWRVSGYFIK